MLDTIMDKLDNIDGLSRVIRDEVEEQTKTTQQLSTCVVVSFVLLAWLGLTWPVLVCLVVRHTSITTTTASMMTQHANLAIVSLLARLARHRICRDLEGSNSRVVQSTTRLRRLK
jgi:multidrug efflux pump subunit AcrB